MPSPWLLPLAVLVTTRAYAEERATIAFRLLPLAALVATRAQPEDITVTLRWHGAYHLRHPPPVYPGMSLAQNVCFRAPAVCLDIRVNQCARGPPGFAYPVHYFTRSLEGIRDGEPVPDHVPAIHTGGGYYFLAEAGAYFRGRYDFILWSNCSEGCEACSKSTGLGTPLRQNTCGETSQNVHAIYSPPNAANCVPSLSEFYRQRHPTASPVGGLLDQVLFWTLVAAILLWCVAGSLILWLVVLWWKERQQRLRAAAVLAAASVREADIERTFPAAPAAATGEEVTCVVCLMDVEEGQACRTLQCRHCFHAKCIDEWWLFKHRAVIQCPLCKRVQNVAAEGGRRAASLDKEDDAEEVFAV